MMNELMKLDLEEAESIMEAVFETTEEKAKERFKITDASRLSWAMRLLESVERERAENVDAVAEKEIQRIKEWQQAEHRRIDNAKSFFESLIGVYLLEQRERDPKFKSQKTPYGSVGFRKQQPKWHYKDGDLVEWLRDSGHADFIRTKEEPDKTAIKKSFKVIGNVVVDENGEVVPGITVEELPESITIKLEKGE